MSGRYRTVALQAVGVAVLAAIVYLAFLRPSEPDPLSGITGPGPGKEASTHAPKGSGRHHGGKQNQKPAKHNGDHGSKNNPGRGQATRKGNRSGGAGPARGPGSATQGGEPNGPPPDSGPPGTSGGIEPPGPETPPGSQYQDTVARITARLNE